MAKNYQLHSFELGPMDNLIHIVVDNATQKAAIFDPGYEAEFLLAFINDNNWTLDKIIITHAHYDHISALNDILNLHPVDTYISQAEHQFYGKTIDPLIYTDTLDEILLGETVIKLVATPGHSAGSVCFQLEQDIITGDTIFIYGCGNCTLPGADPKQLFASLQKLKQLIKPETIVHTSHTYSITNTSTWQEQLDGNPFLHFTNEQAFIEYREHLHDKTRTYPMEAISKDQMSDYL